jgi:TM2 domain-containing membrane protein YozV
MYEKAMLHLENGNADLALTEMKRINSVSMNELRSIDVYRLAFFNYSASDFESARFYLDLLEIHQKDDSLVSPYYLLACLTHFTLNDLERARIYLISAIGQDSKLNRLDQDSVLNTLLPASLEKQLKSEDQARKLSLIPGLGQFYAGFPLQGFASIVLVGLSVTYSTFSIINGYYFSSFATGLSGATLFHSGGSKYAQYLVRVKNERIKEKYSKQIIDFYSNYAGLH